jgi:hypothetical protein
MSTCLKLVGESNNVRILDNHNHLFSSILYI